MIESLANHAERGLMAPRTAKSGPDAQAFNAALAAHTSVYTQGPLAQHLLGSGNDDASERQKRPTRAALSISELSSMAIADLGAPRLSTRAEAIQSNPENQAPRNPAGRPRHDAEPRPGRATSARAPSQDTQRSAPPAESPSRPATTTGEQGKNDVPREHAANPRPSQHQDIRSALRSGAAVSANPQQIPALREQTSGGAGQRQDPGSAARALASAQRQTPSPAASTNSQRPHSFARELEDQTRFAAQLSRGLAAALRQGGGAITMRLQPEALGNLTIRMDFSASRVGASFEVQNDQARQLLDKNMSTLRSALEARGLDVDRLDVRVAEPAERGGQTHSTDAHTREQAGGAGRDDESHGRWEAPRSARSGAAGNHQSPECDDPESALEALTNPSSSLQLWLQQVEMGGAQVTRLRLDAVA